MTEEEWLASIPTLMMHHIAQTAPATPRKLRLLAVAFTRFLETQPDYANAMHVSHLGDEVVEGRRTLAELWDHRDWAWGYEGNWRIANVVLAPDNRIDQALRREMIFSETDPAVHAAGTSPRWALARELILCVIGNPFRPVTLDVRSLTSTALGLAEGIYADRAFDRLPILADALEEAGCDHPDVLAHCRGDGPHARGCWVVDLVLGKT